MLSKKFLDQKYKYSSFTLLETIIAVSIMAIFVLEVAQIQGGGIYFYEYGRNSVKASWLAKRVMSQIEYQWKMRDIKELEVETRETPFKDEPDFKYSITIKEWELPIFDMFTNQKEDSENSSSTSSNNSDMGGTSSLIKEGLSQIMGDSILKVATVKIIWPEGAKTNDMSVSLLLPNQKQLDSYLTTLKSSYDAVISGTSRSK